MNIRHNNQGEALFGFAEVVVNGASLVIKAAEGARSRFQRARNLRATASAIEGLPEDIRHDIGWPDPYERHAPRSCN